MTWLKNRKGGKICSVAFTTFTLLVEWNTCWKRARVCSSEIFREESPLNSSIMLWKCYKRETFAGKFRNNSVAEDVSPCASQIRSSLHGCHQDQRDRSTVHERLRIKQGKGTRHKCKVTKFTEVLSLVLYWKCFYFLHEIVPFLDLIGGQFFPLLFLILKFFRVFVTPLNWAISITFFVVPLT